MVLGSHTRILATAAALMLFLVLFASFHTVFAYSTQNSISAPAHHGLAPHTSDSEHAECPQSIHEVGVSRLSDSVDNTSQIASQLSDTLCVRDISFVNFQFVEPAHQSDFSDHPLDQKVVLRL